MAYLFRDANDSWYAVRALTIQWRGMSQVGRAQDVPDMFSPIHPLNRSGDTAMILWYTARQRPIKAVSMRG